MEGSHAGRPGPGKYRNPAVAATEGSSVTILETRGPTSRCGRGPCSLLEAPGAGEGEVEERGGPSLPLQPLGTPRSSFFLAFAPALHRPPPNVTRPSPPASLCLFASRRGSCGTLEPPYSHATSPSLVTAADTPVSKRGHPVRLQEGRDFWGEHCHPARASHPSFPAALSNLLPGFHFCGPHASL